CWLKLVLHTHGRTKLSEFPIAKNAVTYTTYDKTRKGQFRTKRGTLWAPFAKLVLVKVCACSELRVTLVIVFLFVRYCFSGRSSQALLFFSAFCYFVLSSRPFSSHVAYTYSS
ncbi:hypothetical protein AB205_0027390, partial [Aquarana catesbeiana]